MLKHTHTHVSLSLCPSLSLTHTYTLSLSDGEIIKTLKKHEGCGRLKTAEILLAESCYEQMSFLSLDLNSGRVEESLRSDGREFQTKGARKLKECSPNVLVLCFGTLRSFSHDEQRFCFGSYAHRRELSKKR